MMPRLAGGTRTALPAAVAAGAGGAARGLAAERRGGSGCRGRSRGRERRGGGDARGGGRPEEAAPAQTQSALQDSGGIDISVVVAHSWDSKTTFARWSSKRLQRIAQRRGSSRLKCEHGPE